MFIFAIAASFIVALVAIAKERTFAAIAILMVTLALLIRAW
jgi:hypothetical protein